MTVYLVRHGDAGNRDRWDGPDRHRPLDDVGWKQAEKLVELLGGRDVERIISSPLTRCTQTVEPLAERLGVPIEEHEALVEGADIDVTVELVRRVSDSNTVLCTHGDIVPRLLEPLKQLDGVPLPEEYEYAKGSTWVLKTDGSRRVIRAEYIPPPA